MTTTVAPARELRQRLVAELEEARARTLLLVAPLSDQELHTQHDPLMSPIYANVAAHTVEEARAKSEALRALPQVAGVQTATDLLPRLDEARMQQLRAVMQALGPASDFAKLAARASTPEELESGPSRGRKKVPGEKRGWRPRAGPIGARTASHSPPASSENRSDGVPARVRAHPIASSTSQVTVRLPRSKARTLAVPCSGGTGCTLKRSRRPAVVGSS